MVTTEQRNAARELMRQARRSAAYEHHTMTLLLTTRRDSVERGDDEAIVDTSSHKETEDYRSHLRHHVARLLEALEHLVKTVGGFGAIQAQFAKEHSQQIRSATLIRFPAKTISITEP